MIKNIALGFLPLFILFFTGCSENHNHQHEEESHTEEHHHIQEILVMEDGVELFAEVDNTHDSLKIIAHFTKIDEYAPLSNLNPVWILQAKNTTERVKLKHLHEGIYAASYNITTDAHFHHRLSIQLNNNQIIFKDNHYHDQEHERSGGIAYLKEQAWKDKFGIFRVKRIPFAATEKTSGVIEVAPGGEEVITAGNHGHVEYSGAQLTGGRLINKGDVLLNISSHETNLKSNILTYNKTKRSFEKAQKDFERASALHEKGIMPEKEYLQIKMQYENAKESFEIVSKDYADGQRIIFAPFSGYLSEVFIDNGQHVEAGDPLLAIIKKEIPLMLKADVSQKNYPSVERLSLVTYKTPESKAFNEILCKEKNNFTYSKNLSAAFASLYVDIPENQHPVPGAFAEVYLSFDESTEELVIPKNAIMETEGNHYVYVMTGGETFAKQDIQTGASNGDMIVVKDGLKEGDIIVSEGAYNIKLSSVSGNLPAHGHSH
jgi:RND family efflux transporter MFP subunit